MTRRPDSEPSAAELILDAIQGELDPAAEAALRERMGADPELAAAYDGWQRLAQAEQALFEPAQQTAAAEADAPRLAAWVRSTVAAEQTARARTRFAPAGQRGWARILAWSVGLHVVLLGVLALVMGGADERVPAGPGAHLALEGERDLEPVFDPADVQLAHNFERIDWDDLGAVQDRLALGETESLQDELRDDLDSLGDDQPIAWSGLSHPVGVVVAMARRTNGKLKRRRLDLLGFNASGTLKAVDRGLRYLGRQQKADGSFGDVEQTALGLLAFLGDGHTSRGRTERDRVVARGVTWLRAQVVGAQSGSTAIGIATVALCEDYMLSFGDLPPKAAEVRADEIAALAARARARLERADSRGRQHTWDVWALDATRRTGVVTASDADQRLFRSWVATTAATAGAAGDTMQALSTGTALMFSERGAQKPRFLAWSRANAESLVARLDPTGRARADGDGADGHSADERVGETALILLALQVAYRTY